MIELIMIEIANILGIIGAGIILLAFLLNQINKLKNDDFVYDLLNFIGGFLLVIYAIVTGAIPFIILNTVWSVASLRDLIFKDRK